LDGRRWAEGGAASSAAAAAGRQRPTASLQAAAAGAAAADADCWLIAASAQRAAHPRLPADYAISVNGMAT